MLNKLVMLSIFIIASSVVMASAQDRVIVVPLTKECAPPSFTIGEFKEFLDPGYPLVDGGGEFATMRERCFATQSERLELCVEDFQGEVDQAACEAKMNEWEKLCYKLPEEETVTESELGIIFCTNTVFNPIPVVNCTVAAPCNLGPPDRNGDGKPDICIAGQRCNPANEGAICDPGILWNCNLTTVFYPANIIRPLDRCECECI